MRLLIQMHKFRKIFIILKLKVYSIRFMRPCVICVCQKKNRTSVVVCDKLQKKTHRMHQVGLVSTFLCEIVSSFLNLNLYTSCYRLFLCTECLSSLLKLLICKQEKYKINELKTLYTFDDFCIFVLQ